jgi:hypothetical protein
MCKTQDSEVALGTPWLLSLYQLKYSEKLLEYQSGTAKNIELSHPVLELLLFLT